MATAKTGKNARPKKRPQRGLSEEHVKNVEDSDMLRSANPYRSGPKDKGKRWTKTKAKVEPQKKQEVDNVS